MLQFLLDVLRGNVEVQYRDVGELFGDLNDLVGTGAEQGVFLYGVASERSC